jgi:response regulator of citrate/malate metabolism
MQQAKEKHRKDLHYILDDVMMNIVDTLLENPKIPYNKSQLAKAAGISRDALYRRWDTLTAFNIVKESDVAAEGTYWELNQDSDMVESIAHILHQATE